ncbi:MAG: hypothetical protein IIX44_01805 [Clostridia bacterium]|nr:hypothetical protein [Clostridia bacterium]
MKKTLSLILAICTILSICSFSVAAAPEGTAISSAAEFAAMAADGKYYLANDITLDATYAGPFKGTLDGNGKTITVSAPMFAAIDGATIKNLTVAGAIDGAAADAAAVAVNAAGAVAFENITNKATITNAAIGAGILAVADATATVTMIGCVNEAAISTANEAAGLIGYIYNNINTITDCVNNGEINSTGGSAAGIIARFGENSAKADVAKVIIVNCVNNANVYTDGTQAGGMLAYLVGGTEIKGCVNKGNITSSNNKAGGIFGTSVKDTKNVCAIAVENCINYGTVSAPKVAAGIVGRLGRAVQLEGLNYMVKNCINYGDVKAYTAITYDKATLYIGGIAGYAYGGSLVPANGVVNCVNLGNITADRSHLTGASSLYIGGIVAYVNAVNFECKNNINAGIVTINGEVTGMGNIIYNKKLEGATAETNNYSVVAAEGATDSFTTIVTADQIASGEVAYLINEAAGETIYYQAIGTDKAPVLTAAEDGSNTILKNADGTFANPVKEPEVTEPETTEPETPPTTGDSTVIFAVIAVISILGVAVVAKRREF